MSKFTILILLALFSFGLSQNMTVTKNLDFTPEEVESMLFLYNQTMIKGSDVEVVAPLGAKLKTGLKETRALQDSTAKIVLKLTLNEIGVCLNIIQTATFEAKYAQLVLGMKRKLIKLLPPPQPDNKGEEQKK